MPRPGLLYAQVVKTMKRRRIVEGKHRVVFGTKAAVDQALAACGWQINTAFVERRNLSLRQRVAAMGGEAGVTHLLLMGGFKPLGLQLALSQHFV